MSDQDKSSDPFDPAELLMVLDATEATGAPPHLVDQLRELVKEKSRRIAMSRAFQAYLDKIRNNFSGEPIPDWKEEFREPTTPGDVYYSGTNDTYFSLQGIGRPPLVFPVDPAAQTDPEPTPVHSRPRGLADHLRPKVVAGNTPAKPRRPTRRLATR